MARAEALGFGTEPRTRPPPPSRTKWTRRVPHPVLIGHAASLSQVVPPAGISLGAAGQDSGGDARCVRAPSYGSERTAANRCHFLSARRRIVAISWDTDEDGAPAEERRAEAVRRVELRLGKIGRNGENKGGQ